MKGLALLVMVVLLQGMVVPIYGMDISGDDYGISALNNLIQNEPKTFCKYVTCQENIAPDGCPEDSVYTEGVAQFGCCGGCVRFKQKDDDHCTGSIDPYYGGGYSSEKRSFLTRALSATESMASFLQPNDNMLYSSWCDYYLECAPNRKCEQPSTRKGCLLIQQAYDYALAHPASNPENVKDKNFIYFRDDYRWRPECSPEGDYIEVQCKGPLDGRRCVCVDPTGNRIFGQAFDIQPELYENMNCKCSRKVWERKQAGDTTVTLHCAENGNYEELQCEDGWCYCMNPLTAKPYGPNLPESAMTLLPCHNETLIGKQYLRRCESEQYAFNVLAKLMVNKGVQPPLSALNCDEDGSYSPLKVEGSGYVCRTKYNTRLDGRGPGRCECIRDNYFFQERQLSVQLTCNETGGYMNKQFRADAVFCNDDDGIRTGPLVNMDYSLSLDCGMAKQCQEGNIKSCPLSCETCPLEAYEKYEPPEEP